MQTPEKLLSSKPEISTLNVDRLIELTKNFPQVMTKHVEARSRINSSPFHAITRDPYPLVIGDILHITNVAQSRDPIVMYGTGYDTSLRVLRNLVDQPLTQLTAEIRPFPFGESFAVSSNELPTVPLGDATKLQQKYPEFTYTALEVWAKFASLLSILPNGTRNFALGREALVDTVPTLIKEAYRQLVLHAENESAFYEKHHDIPRFKKTLEIKHKYFIMHYGDTLKKYSKRKQIIGLYHQIQTATTGEDIDKIFR